MKLITFALWVSAACAQETATTPKPGTILAIPAHLEDTAHEHTAACVDDFEHRVADLDSRVDEQAATIGALVEALEKVPTGADAPVLVVR